MDSSEHFTAIATNDNLRKAVIAAVASFLSVGTGLDYSPTYQFFLHAHVNFSWNNRFMVSFNIILRNNAGVLNSGLVKKVGGVCLLKKGITDVFLVAENLVDGACMPSWFTCAGKNTISFKSSCNLIHAVAFKVLSIDSLYNFSLFRVNDKVAIFIFGVSKEAVVVYLYLTVLVAELKSKLYVLT